MAVHIVKLCVGADTVEDLLTWQVWQVQEARKRKAKPMPVCGTRAWPKRAAEVLAGGSLYWVIKGAILVRQRILEIADVTDDHGDRCGLYLDAGLVRTEPRAKRAFQGWRYLEASDAPADLSDAAGGTDLPDAMRRQLADLGAW
jgi:hypothetical protein